MRKWVLFSGLGGTLLLSSAALPDEPKGPSADELAKATQNPVAALTSVPFQFNFTTGGDLGDRTQLVLNFQPVLPLKVNERWNLILRTIVPIVDAPLPGGDRASGIADIQQQLFFTPAESSGLTWGIGPIFSFPTATNDAVRTGQWGIGPTAVVVVTEGPFVLGGQTSQLWRFAGADTGPSLSLFTLQPFINYNLAGGWSVAFSPIITANWSAPSGDVWTVPLGLGLSKVDAIGKQSISISLQYYRNVARPAGVGSDVLRLQINFLFPKLK